jgi:hypothetical protein
VFARKRKPVTLHKEVNLHTHPKNGVAVPVVYIHKIAPDSYDVTGPVQTKPTGMNTEFRTLNWDELCEFIQKETPFSEMIFPTLKRQLESGRMCPLHWAPWA